MPNLQIPPSLIPFLLPVPGHAILLTSPAETKSGSLFLPENAAEAQTQKLEQREATVVSINHKRNKYLELSYEDRDSQAIQPGVKCLFLIHGDEVDNSYVVVKIGQITAILGPDRDSAFDD